MSVAAASVPTLLKKSLTWSIVLSVLMLLAGILAIAVPPIAGIVVTVFVVWWLVFRGGGDLVLGGHAGGTRGLNSSGVLGSLTGINMRFSGTARLMLSLAARRARTN